MTKTMFASRVFNVKARQRRNVLFPDFAASFLQENEPKRAGRTKRQGDGGDEETMPIEEGFSPVP